MKNKTHIESTNPVS